MKQPGSYTHNEIITQPDAWAEAIANGQAAAAQVRDLWQSSAAEEILFTGCGSTYYLSLAAAAIARHNGLAARAAPASEIWLDPAANLQHAEKTVLATVSRSGTTTETLRAVSSFRQAGGRAVLTATCYPDSTLAHDVDLVLAAPRAQERSVAQTRSFASMLLLCQCLVNAIRPASGFAGHMAALPDLGRRLIEQYAGLAKDLGSDLHTERFFFLGNGPRYGLACEAMLKMKEMSLSQSEAYHVLEFRHGPKSMVDERTLVVGLVSDDAGPQERAVLQEMRGLGAHTLALAAEQGSITAGDTIALASGLPAGERLVLYLPILQLLAYERAIAKGLDPDGPRNLTAVVEL